MLPSSRMLRVVLLAFLLLPAVVRAQGVTPAAPAAGAADPPGQGAAQGASAEAPAKAAPPAVAVAADENGFKFSSGDNGFVLRLRGDAMTDARFFPGDDPAPGAETLYLRLVRVSVEGTMFSRFDYRIMPNFGQGRAELQDAYFDARFSPAFKVRVGKFKQPVGLEYLQSPTHTMFVERAYPSGLVPQRDVGAMVHGDVLAGRLSYAVSVYNGVRDGTSQDADLDNGKDVAARLFAHPFKGSESFGNGLGLGVAVTTGTSDGLAADANLPSYRTSGRTIFYRYRSGGEAAVLADGQHLRVVPQAYLYEGPLGLLGEYAVSRQAVSAGAASETLAHHSWLASGSYLLTGEKATFGRLKPIHPYDGNGHWGAFEVLARVHRLALDEASFPTFADPAGTVRSALTFGAGLNWYLNASLRIMLNYEQTRFDAADGGAGRDTEHLLLSRFQVAF